MENRAWVKLYKKVQNSSTYKSLNSKQRDVFIQCLLLANFEEKHWVWAGKQIILKPGEFVTSLESLRKYCASDVSIGAIRKALTKLKSWGFITYKATNHGRLINILNWDTYQANIQAEVQTEDKPRCKQTTDKGATAKKKEVKKKEKDMCTSGYSFEFETWWGHYPKKIAKKKAWEAWNKAADKPGLDDMVRALEAQKQSRQWVRDQGQYIPHPATYLNQGRWADSLQASADLAQIQEKEKDWGQTFIPAWLQEAMEEPKQ